MYKTKQIDEIINKIKDFFDPEKIYLFGSYARGNPSDVSDIDIFVIKATNAPFHKRGRQLRALFKGTGIPLDILVYSPDEIKKLRDIKGNMVNEILNSGVTVYEKK